MFSYFAKNIFNIRFFYEKVSKCNVVIFDEEGSYYIKLLLGNKKSIVINARLDRIFKINLYVIFNLFFLKNIFKYKIKINYYLSLINFIKPKIILTFIDNSNEFFILAKLLHKNIFFLAIQNASRFLHNKINLVSRLFTTIDINKAFIPNYACFSKFEINNFKKKIKVFNYLEVGSLKYSLFKRYFDRKFKNKYDICLIAENFIGFDQSLESEGLFKKTNFESSYEKIARYTCRLANEENLKIVIICKGEKSSKFYISDKENYGRFANNSLNIKIVPNDVKRFSNYKRIHESSLLIGGNSTLLYELLNHRKILACNFLSNKNWFSFKYKKKVCYLEDDRYEIFKKKIIESLNMTSKAYFKKLGKRKNRLFLMAPPSKTLCKLKSIIQDYVD